MGTPAVPFSELLWLPLPTWDWAEAAMHKPGLQISAIKSVYPQSIVYVKKKHESCESFRRLRQEDHEFEVNLDYIIRPHLSQYSGG